MCSSDLQTEDAAQKIHIGIGKIYGPGAITATSTPIGIKLHTHEIKLARVIIGDIGSCDLAVYRRGGNNKCE